MVIERPTRTGRLLDAAVTIVTGVAAMVLIWRLLVPVGPEPTGRTPTFEDIAASALTATLTDAPIRGSAGAPLVLIEFSDFECPFCARFARETFDRLDRDFIQAGRLEYAVKHFPLSDMHPHARAAAQSAWCAQAQGRFWEMRGALFARRRLAGADWRDMAAKLDLDTSRFDECLTDPASAFSIDADEEDGTRLGVLSTPTFFLGRRTENGTVSLLWRLRGAAPYSVFEDALRRQLGA